MRRCEFRPTPRNRRLLGLLLGLLLCLAAGSRLAFVHSGVFGENPDTFVQILLPGKGIEPGSPLDGVRERYGSFWASSYPPLFPHLIWWARSIVPDPVLAARGVSLAGGLLVVVAVFLLARSLYSARIALFAALLAAFSPLLFYHSVKGRPETLFVLFLTLSCMGIVRLVGSGEGKFLALAFAAGGMALFTKLEGILLIPPLAAALLFHLFSTTGSGPRRPALYTLCAAFYLPAVLYFARHGASGKVESFGVGGLLSWDRFIQAVLWTEQSFFAMAYLATFPVTLLFLIGLLAPSRRSTKQWVFAGLVIYFTISNILAHAVYTDWQTRYFYLPMPLVCVTAAAALKSRTGAYSRLRRGALGLLAACAVLFSLFYSFAMLWGERDLFVDVKDLALYAAENLPEDTLLTDESIITVYYSSKHGVSYAREALAPGMVVALHDFFCDFYLGRSLEEELRWLHEHWEVSILHETRTRFIPISGNAFAGSVLQRIARDHPFFLDYRYQPLENRSILLRVNRPRVAGDPNGDGQ